MSVAVSEFKQIYSFVSELELEIPRNIFEDDSYNIILLSGEKEENFITRSVIELINRYNISYTNLVTIIKYNLDKKFDKRPDIFTQLESFKVNLYLHCDPKYLAAQKKSPGTPQSFIKHNDDKYKIVRGSLDNLASLSAPTRVNTNIDRQTESPVPPPQQQVEAPKPRTTSSASAFAGVTSPFGNNNNNKSQQSSRTSSSVKIITPSEDRKSVPPSNTLSNSSHPFSQHVMTTSVSSNEVMALPVSIGNSSGTEPIPHSSIRQWITDNENCFEPGDNFTLKWRDARGHINDGFPLIWNGVLGKEGVMQNQQDGGKFIELNISLQGNTGAQCLLTKDELQEYRKTNQGFSATTFLPRDGVEYIYISRDGKVVPTAKLAAAKSGAIRPSMARDSSPLPQNNNNNNNGGNDALMQMLQTTFNQFNQTLNNFSGRLGNLENNRSITSPNPSRPATSSSKSKKKQQNDDDDSSTSDDDDPSAKKAKKYGVTALKTNNARVLKQKTPHSWIHDVVTNYNCGLNNLTAQEATHRFDVECTNFNADCDNLYGSRAPEQKVSDSFSINTHKQTIKKLLETWIHLDLSRVPTEVLEQLEEAQSEVLHLNHQNMIIEYNLLLPAHMRPNFGAVKELLTSQSKAGIQLMMDETRGKNKSNNNNNNNNNNQGGKFGGRGVGRFGRSSSSPSRSASRTPGKGRAPFGNCSSCWKLGTSASWPCATHSKSASSGNASAAPARL